MEALQLGAVQMLAPSLAKFGPLGVKEFEVFVCPISSTTTTNCTKSPRAGGRPVTGQARTKGIKGLAYWDNGFKSFS